jgi:hypothetical protein
MDKGQNRPEKVLPAVHFYRSRAAIARNVGGRIFSSCRRHDNATKSLQKYD